jgi:hypothetical protein
MITKNGAGPRHCVGDDGPREDRLGSAINLTHTALDRTTQAPLQISADLEETAIAISPAALPVVDQPYDYAALSSDTADLVRRTADQSEPLAVLPLELAAEVAAPAERGRR